LTVKRIALPLSLALILAGIVIGCAIKSKGAPTSARLPKTPEQSIQQLIERVNAGDYGGAAALMSNGPGMWANSPGTVKSYIDGHTSGVQIASYEDHGHKINGDGATYTVLLMFQNGGKRWSRVEFIQRPEGWLITDWL
jgi:hypothetical protein